ncbi:MAG: porin [Gammaproteobacteria bacterium]|nr:porin [Gammaproteobacteria bacterium]
MNKKLLAVAIALAFSSAAMADVKVTGKVQAELVSISGDGSTAGLYLADGTEGHKVNAGNAGALGVVIKHDLGNGLTALAKANFSIQMDANAVGLGKGRDGYVGLNGGFGTVLAGRIATPYKMSTVKWDPFLATSLQARGSAGMSQLHNGYADNVLAYANKFGGVKVVGAVALDESLDATATPAATKGDHAITFSVNAPIGSNLELALGYIDMGGTDTTAVKVGAKFKSGAITVSAQYETLGQGIAATASAKSSAAMPGTDSVSVIYGNVSFKMSSANTIAAAFGSAASDGSDDSGDATYASAGMLHSFNKKVRGHVGFRSVTGKTSADESTTLVGGLRVKF